jgi:CRISPR-associated endonuclease Csn1
MENRLNFIGGAGKTRLDRRHHTMDAATVAMMRPSVAKTLLERQNLRTEQRFTGGEETWQAYSGAPGDQGAQLIYQNWLEQMRILTELLNEALAKDEIPVFSNFRLRLGDGKAHADQIEKLGHHKVGDAWSMADIDRSATEALWCALTRDPDFEWMKGLPENPDRKIVVNGTHFGPDDEVEVFRSPSAQLKVRGGAVALGNTIHHARIYRFKSGKNDRYGMVRVFAHDLLKHAHEDLFNAPLKPQSVSMRDAEPKLRTAIRKGEAEYLGWIVVGDELEIDPARFRKGAIAEFNRYFPNIKSWYIVGFDDNRRVKLRPSLIASEGLPEDAPDSVNSIVAKRGWRTSLDAVITQAGISIIRRNSLGRIRRSSKSNLPVSWSIDFQNDA